MLGYLLGVTMTDGTKNGLDMWRGETECMGQNMLKMKLTGRRQCNGGCSIEEEE